MSGGEISLLDTCGRLMSLRHDLRTGLARQLAQGELSLIRNHNNTRGVQLSNHESITTILEHEDTVLRELNLTRMDIGYNHVKYRRLSYIIMFFPVFISMFFEKSDRCSARCLPCSVSLVRLISI